MTDRDEIAACILEPHFDAVRDVFASYEPEPGAPLERLRRTRLLVDPAVHDGGRHFAGCRDDGMLIKLAPEAAELEAAELVAIVAHEFGHAADFGYPGDWVLLEPGTDAQRIQWIGSRTELSARRWRRIWHDRSADEVEWTADAIAQAVTGRRLGYCGPCLIQCFGGARRPAGLR